MKKADLRPFTAYWHRDYNGGIFVAYAYCVADGVAWCYVFNSLAKEWRHIGIVWAHRLEPIGPADRVSEVFLEAMEHRKALSTDPLVQSYRAKAARLAVPV